MGQNHSSDRFPTIGQRLEELPYVVYRQIAPNLIQQRKLNRRTFYRVLSGESQNLQVIMELADFLECTVDQVLDPDHFFEDPRKSSRRRTQLAERLGARLTN